MRLFSVIRSLAIMYRFHNKSLRSAKYLVFTSVASVSSTACTFSSCSSSDSSPFPCLPPMSDASRTVNPLLDHSGLPRFKEIKPEHVKPAVKENLAALSKDFKSLESAIDAGKARDYADVVEELEKIQAPLGYSWGVVGHLMGVKNSDALREAHDSVQSDVIKQEQEIGQSAAIFHILESIKANNDMWKDLDEAQQRIVDASLFSMTKSGVGLPEKQKQLFNQFNLEISELSTKFSNNLLDATKAYKLTVTDKNDLEGLPQSTLGLLASKAVSEGHEGATAEKGPWIITLDYPSYGPCMQHLKNRVIREKLYRAFVTRASTGDEDNSKIINDIMRKKKGVAKMLGYNNYAELSLAEKMAPDVKTVLDLIEMLRAKSLPAAEKEFEELKQFAAKGGCNELELWDVAYWSERLREEKFEFEEEQLRVYFPLENVLSGMFSLIERLFSVKIEAADGEQQVWHPDVRFFKIYESNAQQGSDPIAAFYLDPFSRPGEKNGGAWMNVCVGKSKVLKRIPVAYLTCNGSPPTDGKPSLMTFREVETLFHETGHGLQHMLTKVEHGDAAGINNVEWDAVELPSQFMENWCYDRPTLYGFAKHYETGEPLPDELFEKIKAAKNFNAGMMMMRQLFFGKLDMTLHSSYDPSGDVSPFDIQQEIAKDYTLLPPLKDDRFLCSFGHIFAGGYAAGYYSYKWAEVMSADAFAAFEEAGLDDEEAVKRTGKRFRDTILAMGGGKHPSKVYELYRGKEASPDALLRHSGLTD